MSEGFIQILDYRFLKSQTFHLSQKDYTMLLGSTEETVMDRGISSKDFPHTIPSCHSFPVVHLSTKQQV